MLLLRVHGDATRRASAGVLESWPRTYQSSFHPATARRCCCRNTALKEQRFQLLALTWSFGVKAKPNRNSVSFATLQRISARALDAL